MKSATMEIPKRLRSLFPALIISFFGPYLMSFQSVSPPKELAGINTIPEFISNNGQVADQHGNANRDVLFIAPVPFGNITITKTGISFTIISLNEWQLSARQLPGTTHQTNSKLAPHNREPLAATFYRVDMQLLGANRNAEVVPMEETGDYNNYYLANCPEGITHVKKYRTIRMKDIYDGIDLVIYGTYGNQIQYDFIVHPGGDPAQIRFRFDGAGNVIVSGDGSLICSTPFGNIGQGSPFAYQTAQSNSFINSRDIHRHKKLPGITGCDANFRVHGDQSVSLEIKGYDPNQVLIIDPPTRLWGTYYGGNSGDEGEAVATDGDGNVYLAGPTYSQLNQAIATTGAHQVTYGGDYYPGFMNSGDAFLAKFNSQGVRQWGTYYGGAGSDGASALAIDREGNIFMAGGTSSPTAIATPGVHMLHLSSITSTAADAFLVKFNATGVRVWGTYYGGPSGDGPNAVLADDDGNAYLVGSTSSTIGISTVGSHQPALAGGGTDGFIVKFNSQGGCIWGTYFGGDDYDFINAAAMDSMGNIFVAGSTWSDSGIATVGSWQPMFGGSRDGFLARFSSQGTLAWSTYYGGDQMDECFALTIDPSGHLYIGGSSNSNSGIATPGAHQLTFCGPGYDAFLARFNTSGARLWGTFYGGTGYDEVWSLATDQQNSAYIGGTTTISSGIGIATPGSHQPSFGGHETDAYLAKFTSGGIREWGTYYGGLGVELGQSVAIDPQNNVYLSGHTSSYNGIATPGSHQPQFGGYDYCLGDAYLVKFQPTYIGIHESEDQNSLRVFPNPTQGDVWIYSGLPLLNRPYSISNLAGQEVLSGIITAEDQPIPLGNLPGGCYFIHMDNHRIIKIIRY